MDDTNVIKLPVADHKKTATKRNRPPRLDSEEEEQLRQQNRKRVAVLGEEDDSVKRLETLVFGAEEELLERLVEEDVEEQNRGLLLEDGDEDADDSEEEEGPRQQLQSRKAAWLDEDDELEEEVDMRHRYRRNLMKGEAESVMSKQKLQQRMKEQFQKSMGGTPSWAQTNVHKKKKKAHDEEEDEDEDDLLRRTGNFVASSESLPSGILKMKKCLHANSARPSEDKLTTVQFHPSAQVVMTAGIDQSVSLFQVDGKTNPKIQSIHLERFPVHKAQFSQDGETVIATSLRNKMFYLYDMMEGRVVPVQSVRGLNEARVKEFSVCPDGGALLLTGTNGYLHLLTLKTNEVVCSMKINGDVSGVAFSRDGSKVFVNSEEGEVYVWDMRSSRCLHRFTDDGCVKGTSIAASLNGRYLACGSQAGVVNIYSQEACLNSSNPKPLRAVMNLLTSATSLRFNPTSEILAIASRVEDEAVRLVHLSSLTVFSNFPVAKRKVAYRASCLDFSPHSGFFSLANNKGHAPLFRLLHYKDF
ncbi:U3 small nucleolar RNA-associated protein 18 homolog [Girardinichthys multiradiatus]|uniref:U3 small nucleolar RNA-associated protein 18 homolog n=1 Tax=Girardinichthys multiradiatus TaxID=208333 RepID=UPI001FAD75A2|nr:U3 small nucleolar RNA-associated protein 18 homolog [Girardinichthys multiradiatus]XP_047214306.1 U3 small nucleolar RNA-associated protein 18 homolog [Girardinichthys multiradiatus]